MKKELYLCGAMLVAMASCSNEGNIPGESESNELEPVVLGLQRASASVEESGARTRGTGTVGGTTVETNKWNFENLYVLMTTSSPKALEGPDGAKPNWGFTSVTGEVLKEQFDNSFFARPVEKERDGEKVWNIDYTVDPNAGGNLKYYPATGVSDFFAYYVDDAAEAAGNTDDKGNPGIVMETVNTNNEVENTAISVAFKINGSQDLLLGKAGYEGYPNDCVNKEGGFSAKTARAGAIPNIKMSHMLSRLTFTLKNGNANAANVVVKSISVVSKNTGKMYVAYKDEPAEKMVWEAATERFYLKQRMPSTHPDYFVSSKEEGKCPLSDLEPIEMDGVNDVDAGEALFICPGEKLYMMYIEVEQEVTAGGVSTIENDELELELKLSPEADVAFMAGTSYHVNATIYGFEQIVLDVDLEPWNEHDEDINVGGDDDIKGAIF